MEKEQSTGKENQNLLVAWKNTNAKAAMILVLMVFVGLPLVFHNYYYDILKIKYWLYCGSVISITLAILIITLVFIHKDGVENNYSTVKAVLNGFTIKSLKATDWAMIFFLIAAGISTLQSEYRFESFWGNEGRLTGLFLILLYAVSFFIITKFLEYKSWYLDVLLAAGIVVCFIGIMHYFELDPIGFKLDLSPEDYKIFVSTIGNINTYTSYVSLIVGSSVLLFCVERNRIKKLWYALVMVVSIFALITGISDNAYLAMIALVGILPLYLFNNVHGLKNYVIILATLSTEFMCINYIGCKIPGHVMEINGLFNVIAGYSKLPIIVAVLWGAAVAISILEYKLLIDRRVLDNNIGRWMWLGVLFVIFLGGCYILYDANILGNVDKYGSLRNYIVFSDDWGTRRGYVWRISMEIYEGFPVLHKLFGYGPDTFGIITVNTYYEDMVSKYSEKYDSAHNEYIQYLITIGIVGLTAYLGLLCTALMRIVRTAKNNPIMMAVPIAVLCYSAQAFVNISVPMVAPIMMTLIMVGLSAGRENE